MPNIQFNYLYRDAANYKNFGFVVFANEDIVSIDELEFLIRSKLIDGEFFYAGQWNLPDLHFKSYNYKADHNFHEFESIAYTDRAPNTALKFNMFMALIKRINGT